MTVAFFDLFYGTGSYTNHILTKGGRGVAQKTTTLHNSYIVKVATFRGEGVKILKRITTWLVYGPYD